MFMVSRNALGNLIGKAESSDDYSAYNFVENGKMRSRYKTDLTEWNLREILQSQKEKKMYAIGRYQLLQTTLEEAIKALRLSLDHLFNEGVQDYIFDGYLITRKRPAIMTYIEGAGDYKQCRLGLAREWASMPVLPGTTLHNGSIAKGGESYYAGDGRNKAHITDREISEALEATKSAYRKYKHPGY